MTAHAIEPPTVVYRIDGRTLGEVSTGPNPGMWPRPGPRDMNLARHFDGESLEDHTSGFLSTSASLQIAVAHAASLARPNSEEPFDHDFLTYLYMIRPGARFYDVEAAFRHAMDGAPAGSQLRGRYAAILRDFGGMEEWVAAGGFDVDRIISVAPLTGEMLRRYYDDGALFSPLFWQIRWTNNPRYAALHDNDRANSQAYPQVGTPRGFSMARADPETAAVAVAVANHPGCPRAGDASPGKRDTTDCATAWPRIRYWFYDRGLLSAAVL